MFEILLVMLGIGALGWAFGAFDHREEDDDDDEQGEAHVVGPEQRLDTGDGNDTVTSGTDGAYGLKLVTGDGDDVVRLLHNPSGDVQVNGGDGDDTIQSVHVGSYHGENGHDELIGQGADTMLYGGGGQDNLLIRESHAPHGNRAYGGEGSDTLTAIVDVTQIASDNDTWLIGGAGRDHFAVQINGVADRITNADDPNLGNARTIATIRDFNPAEDNLSINMADLGPAGPDLTQMSLSYFSNSANLTLRFSNGVTSVVEIPGLTRNSGFGVDDIFVVGAEPGRAFAINGPETINGGSGDDQFTFGVNTRGDNMQIDGGGGADRFRADNLISAEGMDLAGGDGNDRIEVNTTNSSTVLEGVSFVGGAGDDYIATNAQGLLSGGGGNDTISGSVEGVGTQRLYLSGGGGDDVLEVAIDLQNTSAPAPLLSGDGGQDDLTLTIYGSVPPLSGPVAASRDLATIQDFSPADDHLTIEVDAGLATPTIRLELSAVGSSLPSYVVLDYPGGTVGRVVLTGINAGSGLTIGDIELVRLVA